MNKKIMLTVLTILCASQSMQAQQTKVPMIVKALLGGTIGGLTGYFFDKMAQHAVVKEFKNKETFLNELQSYVNSSEYMNEKNSDRMYSHYYNGLNQLAKQTTGVGVDLLKDFSMNHNKDSHDHLVQKINALAQRIKKAHENGLFFSKIFMTTFFALFGSLIATTDRTGEGTYMPKSNNYAVAYVPSYSSNKFFQ